MVSRTSIWAHGAAFLAVGFAVGICARAAADFYDTRSTPAPPHAPRDVLVVTPATEDSPAMMLWVAAELETATAPVHATLSYRLEAGLEAGLGAGSTPAPRAQTISSR